MKINDVVIFRYIEDKPVCRITQIEDTRVRILPITKPPVLENEDDGWYPIEYFEIIGYWKNNKIHSLDLMEHDLITKLYLENKI